VFVVPRALIRLAARHLPAGMRADRTEEWEAELAAIAGQTEGLPLTRFVRGLRYASSLFLHTGALTSALTDRSRFALTLTAGRRSLATLMHTAAAGYCLLGVVLDVRYSITDGLPADKAFSVLFFAGYGCLGAGALLHSASQWAPGAGWLRRVARLLGVLGLGSFWISSTVTLVPLLVVLARRHRGRAG
jgi:hypothetical protein